MLLLWSLLATTPAVADPPPPAARTILDLQPFRQESVLRLGDGPDAGGEASLVNLNPAIGVWYLLSLRRGDTVLSYHLEAVGSAVSSLRLDPQGLSIGGEPGVKCALWGRDGPLDAARRTGLPYQPICDGRLYLRKATAGTYTNLERVTNFLRDHVWGGDRIVSFVRDQFYRDAFVERPAPVTAQGGMASQEPAAPAPGRLAAGKVAATAPVDLGIDLGRETTSLGFGQWYPVRDVAGIWVSAAQPQALDPPAAAGFRGRVDHLDEVEAAALDYLVAFDLSQFHLGFALGTDHPRLGWSEHALSEVYIPGLPGPDGIDSDAPLARTGMVNPALSPRVVAAFTGGFKREHGAFRYGELAYANHGSHYGFIEEGVVFSSLQPGLSTLYVLADGSVGMKTWSAADSSLLPHIRYARQNGVALVETDPASGTPQPGALVTQWGAGNWSGSKDEQFRTLRAGVCLAGQAPREFLVYGYFSAATPRAMARVFQAYGCRYAMHLDMNALEHTYLAVYARRGGRLLVQHLIEGMAEVDKKGGDQLAPRFLGFPDDRDFFYLLRRGEGP